MEASTEQLAELTGFAAEIRRVVLLGMGSWSLAANVFRTVFPRPPDAPALTVLDTVHPDAVRAVVSCCSAETTLFLVSSKSGTTVETLTLFRFFWEWTGRVGHRFAAITDPGKLLEELARTHGFRRVFYGLPDVGGRYSALTPFGLVPAALVGVNVKEILDRAWVMVEACAACVSIADNAWLQLGTALGELAQHGRDKVTLLTSPGLGSLGAWVEQLLAESTGKAARGLVPVVGEAPGPPKVYGPDRVFVQVGAGDPACLNRLAAAGHPVATIGPVGRADVGQEFFRWELATAAAGAVLGVNPFDQPDVELAKELARRWLKASGAPRPDDGTLKVTAPNLVAVLRGWLAAAQAYLAPSPRTAAGLQASRTLLRDRLRLATTVGYGPRYLHPTGQLHKGGPNTGLFLQITAEPRTDLPVPGESFTFGGLLAAQALGEYEALVARGRRVVRVDLGRDVGQGLPRLLTGLREALEELR